MSFCCSGQGLIQDFLQGIFLKKFWIFSDSRTDEFSYNNFGYSIFIGSSLNILLPVYHIPYFLD